MISRDSLTSMKPVEEMKFKHLSQVSLQSNNLDDKSEAETETNNALSADENINVNKENIKNDQDRENMNDNPVKENVKDYQDKEVQTENVDLLQALRKIVKERIYQYEEASRKDESIDRKLSPLLQQLQEENENLRKLASGLQIRLDAYEKKNLKKRDETSFSAPQAKRQTLISNSLDIATDRSPLLNNRIPTLPEKSPTSTVHQRIYTPPQTSYMHPIPDPSKQFIPQRQRPPVQMVSPVQQISTGQQYQNVRREPYPTKEARRAIDNHRTVSSEFNSHNIQLVAANTDLCMTTHQSGFQVPRVPVNNPTNRVRNIPTEINNRSNIYQPLSKQDRLPSANETLHNKILEHAHNVNNVRNRPFNFPPMLSRQHKGPNIAMPFSTLPRLKASISASGNGIILTWDYEIPEDNIDKYKVECYQLFAHQAKNTRVNPPPDIKQWKKIGVVNALPLPMACTLTQFATGNVYYFAVLAVDIHGREGEMSNPCIIRLNLNS